MYINTNTSALFASNRVNRTEFAMNKSIEKLSSGQRINRASDDAAGLAISQKMESDIRGFDQAKRNVQDGISAVQTAEGALEQVESMLQRMRELSVQGSSGTYDTDAGADMKAEFDELASEIGDISTKTNFNGTALLGGGTLAIQSGTASGDTITINLADISALTGTADDISTNGGASGAITKLDADIKTVSTARATLGAGQNRLEYTMNNVANMSENLTAAKSRITDADMATEMSEYSKQSILIQSGMSVLAQANQKSQYVLKLLQ